jgi:hypothetical protein
VTSRKKKIILIQIFIFFITSILLYNTYRNKNKETEPFVKIESQTAANSNYFKDIEYSGFDLSGNRYVLKAEEANFKTETPELISMKSVIANFFLKDGTILSVVSDKGLYNNITLDMEFREKVEVDYLSHDLFSDLLLYSNSTSKLIATGNVRGESVEKGKFNADNVEYDLLNNVLNFSMFSNEQIKIKLKNL